MTSAFDSDIEGSTRHIAVASQCSICPCTLTPLLLLLYLSTCTDITLESLQAAITPHPYTHPTPSLSLTLHHALPALLP